MPHFYEAVAVTKGAGTFRAFPTSDTCICVTEDGVAGVLDSVNVEPHETAPEGLTHFLLVYLYENVRGVDLYTLTLSRRR
jgi:hypothetical protein